MDIAFLSGGTPRQVRVLCSSANTILFPGYHYLYNHQKWCSLISYLAFYPHKRWLMIPHRNPTGNFFSALLRLLTQAVKPLAGCSWNFSPKGNQFSCALLGSNLEKNREQLPSYISFRTPTVSTQVPPPKSTTKDHPKVMFHNVTRHLRPFNDSLQPSAAPKLTWLTHIEPFSRHGLAGHCPLRQLSA